MVIPPFEFSGAPLIRFGCGVWNEVPDAISRIGASALVFTGSVKWLPSWERFCTALDRKSVVYHHYLLRGEPTPGCVDSIVEDMRGKEVDVVVSIGGGSVIDTGKAVSAMLPSGDKVQQYLEGVGSGKKHDGRKVPFIAVPTTAGTGSEATQNAVLGEVGRDGFKRSLRHDRFVPNLAFVDPELTLTCPAMVTAACGLDAFTQLLEAYVSTAASPLTDMLALEGLKGFGDGNLLKCVEEPDNLQARSALSLGALLSGIVLANAGLGVVHGLAAPIGGMVDIPHGVVCGTLIAESIRLTLRKLEDQKAHSHPALMKYKRVSDVVFGEKSGEDPLQSAWRLVEKIEAWTTRLQVPRLGSFGLTTTHFSHILEGAGSKNHPLVFTTEEMAELLENRI